MNFTSSPFERMMKEKPRPQAPAENRPPRGSACCGCCYWRYPEALRQRPSAEKEKNKESK